jgi:hypothetical protein
MRASTEGVPQASQLGIAPLIVLLPFVRAALRQAKASSSTCALHLIESTHARILRGERLKTQEGGQHIACQKVLRAHGFKCRR